MSNVILFLGDNESAKRVIARVEKRGENHNLYSTDPEWGSGNEAEHKNTLTTLAKQTKRNIN